MSIKGRQGTGGGAKHTVGGRMPLQGFAEYRYTPTNCPRELSSEHLRGMRYDGERDLFVCDLCGFEASAEMGGI